MTTRAEKLANDRRAIIFWLWMMPLITLKQLVLVSGLSKNRVHRLLTGLRHDKLVTRRSLTGTDRKLQRWWLSSAGVKDYLATRSHAPIPWQVTHEGIDGLIKRIAVVEHLYDVAINLWANDGVRTDRPVRMMDKREDMGEVAFRSDLKMRGFTWFDRQPVDAVAIYEGLPWVALKWLGPEVTYHHISNVANQVADVPGATFDIDRGPLTPAGWVIVCADQLAAKQAADAFPGENVLAVTVDGRVEKAMQPADFSVRLGLHEVSHDPGLPELLGRRGRRDPQQQAPTTALSYAVFGFIAARRGATRDQLRRKFSERYLEAVKDLKPRGFIVEREDGFYVGTKGIKLLADIDGLDHATVMHKHGVFLKRDGVYRRQQQRHDRALVNVEYKFGSEGIPAFDGSRHLINFGETQLSPDLVLCLKRKNGSTLVVFVELEFTARYRQRMGTKVGTYELADRLAPELIPSAWVVEDHGVRELCAQMGKGGVMITAVLEEFLAGTSWGPESVWFFQGERESINCLVEIMDIEVPP